MIGGNEEGIVSGHDDPNHIEVYESSGIQERSGSVPLWLWIVYIALTIWGAFYLHDFWNTPQ